MAHETIRSQIRHEIELIEPFDQLERETQQNVLAWIDSDAQIFRLRKPADPPQHLIAYSVVVDDDHILLVDHINAELWLPPGGHVDPGEHPRQTAIREAREELNIDYRGEIAEPVLLTTTETVGKTAGHTDVCLWYLLKTDRTQALQFDHSEFNTATWFHHDELPLHRTDQHMQRFVQKQFSP
jgi:ADP-ribose pyrophosphatase YjhB (NUDIX family)